MIKKLTYEDVYKRFKEKGYELLDNQYISSQTRMTCMDKEGYKYYISNNSLQNGSYPEKYNKFNPYTLENVQHMLDLESNGSKLLTKEYKGSRMDLEITCECCGKKIIKKWDTIVNNKNFKCFNCNNNNKRYDFNFIKQEFLKYGYRIIDENYIGNNKPLNCIDSEGYKVKISYSNLTNNKLPNRFSIRFNKENYIYNINRYFKINNINCRALYYLKDKFLSDYNVIICECECGNKFETCWSAIKNGQVRCRNCTKYMSNMEYKVKKWLDDNDIDYVCQKKFNDCKDIRCLPFDFYLPKFNHCIEVDGQQHYFPSVFSKKANEKESFELTQKHDKIKNNYCKKHNIGLLRIGYNDIRRKNNNYINILSNKFIKN